MAFFFFFYVLLQYTSEFEKQRCNIVGQRFNVIGLIARVAVPMVFGGETQLIPSTRLNFWKWTILVYVSFCRLVIATMRTKQSLQASEKKEVDPIFSQSEPDLCLLMTFYSPHSSSLPESAVAIHNAGDCHRINLCPCTSLTIRPSAVIHLRVMSPLSYLENIWGRQYTLWGLPRDPNHCSTFKSKKLRQPWNCK